MTIYFWMMYNKWRIIWHESIRMYATRFWRTSRIYSLRSCGRTWKMISFTRWLPLQEMEVIQWNKGHCILFPIEHLVWKKMKQMIINEGLQDKDEVNRDVCCMNYEKDLSFNLVQSPWFMRLRATTEKVMHLCRITRLELHIRMRLRGSTRLTYRSTGRGRKG